VLEDCKDFFVNPLVPLEEEIEGLTQDVADINQDIIDLDSRLDVVEGGYLGTIAHDAQAPTPGRSGLYRLTSTGIISWITGTPTGYAGDEISVIFNDPDYVYSLVSNPYALKVVQTTGTSENNVMSQSAVTDRLNKLLSANRYYPRLSHMYYDDSAIARKQPETLAYNGTTYYVDSSKADDTGNGLTPATAKKTIMAAYGIAANGSVLQLADGTYDLASETGGYCLFNTTNKGVLIKGNALDKTAVILSQASGSFALRFRNCGSMKLQDLTLTTSGSVVSLYSDFDNAYSNNNQQYVNCKFINNGSARLHGIYGMALIDTKEYNINFINCELDVSTTAETFLTANMSNTLYYLISGCNIIRDNNSFIKNADGKANYYLYDSTILMNGNYVSVQQGKDTATPTFDFGILDIRESVITYAATKYQHAILIGRGVKSGICINNKISMDSINNSSALGIVVKSTCVTLGDFKIYGNYVTAPRPIYIKGGSKNDIKYNSFINNITNFSPFGFTNYLDGSTDILSDENNVECNNMIGVDDAIMIFNDPTSEQSEVTIQNNTFKDNRYYITGNYLWIDNTSTGYTWADRQTFWNPDNDLDSLRLTDSNLPVKLIE
jgi:hypothetical protein